MYCADHNFCKNSPKIIQISTNVYFTIEHGMYELDFYFVFYLLFNQKKQFFAILPPDSTLFGKKIHTFRRTLYIITDGTCNFFVT